MQWSDIVRGAGFTLPFSDHNGGLEFHHLSLKDTLSLARALQKNQKHLEAFLPMFNRHDSRGLADVQRLITRMLAEAYPAQHFVFTYRGKVCGLASTLPISRNFREVQLRYMVFEGFTGQGLATRIAATLELYAFNVWDYERVFIEMDSHNRASMRVPQKLGYEFLGAKEGPLTGNEATGFWYSYVKENPLREDPAG